MRASTFLMVILGLMVSTSFILNISARYGMVNEAPSFMPKGAYAVKDLGRGWHTFRMDIGGKKGRLFLHRLYPNYNNTESLTEVMDADEVETMVK